MPLPVISFYTSSNLFCNGPVSLYLLQVAFVVTQAHMT
ncbi:hypothetical protein BFV94_4270 [Alteromonas macleodii]|uniref:Uncharacterized protein n=1 Tax=Alteromonas macleodii TaxID=28108 RepID=A0AB36FNK0_ALTMA|nr:hypothetical protein BFV93_4577 [Alteromonas macleodii]OES25245.1 hypothetical protein BFV95_4456 [Alteromonas macleodii]OES25924.1 hypothetical protein BFV94_4270 [Alteromonas macleodii]OES38746.1 hypothetical protein BFV96_4676 [Alteromonas macleodii]